jgi:hypothetical protein
VKWNWRPWTKPHWLAGVGTRLQLDNSLLQEALAHELSQNKYLKELFSTCFENISFTILAVTRVSAWEARNEVGKNNINRCSACIFTRCIQ